MLVWLDTTGWALPAHPSAVLVSGAAVLVSGALLCSQEYSDYLGGVSAHQAGASGVQGQKGWPGPFVT